MTIHKWIVDPYKEFFENELALLYDRYVRCISLCNLIGYKYLSIPAIVNLIHNNKI